MATGMTGFLGVGVESSGGSSTSAYSATVMDFIPFISETMALQRNDLPDPSIWTNYYERRMYNGLQNVTGGVQTIAHPLLTGYLLRSAFDANTAVLGSTTLVACHGSVREHRFTALGTQQFMTGSGSDLPTLTLEVNRGPIMGSGSSFVYYNCAGNVAELVIQAGQLMHANFEFIGRDYGGKPRSTPSYVPPEAFLWNTASISIGGTAKPIYEGLTFRVENGLTAVPALDGRLRPDLVKRDQFGHIVVNGNISFRNFADYDGFVQGSEYLLQCIFTGKIISSAPTNNEAISITVPRFRYSTYPVNAGGPGRITVGFTGRGMIDPTSNYAAEIAIVNTRLSSYLVNTTG